MKLHGVKLLLGLAVASLTAIAVQAEEPASIPAIDPALPPYQRVEGLKGKLTLIGSDTLGQMASVWGQHFQQLYPEVKVEVVVKGSVNAVASVMDGQAQIGLLSRQINQDEIAQFQKRFGYLPTVLTPSFEPIGIYVHQDNPITSLTMQQLDAIFSTSLKRGAPKTATTWGDVGLAGNWATAPIAVQGRTPTTGSQLFFQAGVLGGGEFRKEMVSNPSNLGMIKAVAANPNAIGFVGAIHEIPGVKAVPLAMQPGSTPIGVHSHGYPLVRPLQIVLNNSPKDSLSPLEVEFVKFIFSKSGQQDVVISGFAPISGAATEISLQAIGVHTLN
ncbi:PstS family phosphate ABC transporter substrate-binding protein [Planctomicrobium sp. SH664]|uniref:PstS family phosphate ABC transporter substrate-binding protein n=1 Tax=Planctomicrobium sp. SH664 TaxID=3448125 RepID=UPI003F5C264A